MGNHQNKERREISSLDASPSPATSHLEREFEMDEAKSKCNQKDDNDQSEDGKPVDPRLIALLEFFDELRGQNRDLFSKIFPKIPEEHVETIKKFKVKNSINYKLDNIRKIQKSEKGKANGKLKGGRMMRKSSSIGSPRELSRDIGGGEQLKLERFKVKTVEIGLDDEKRGGDGGKKTTGGDGGKKTTGGGAK